MRKIVILIIRFYQLFISPLQALFPTAGCRFYPSCSQYAINSVRREGILRGIKMGGIRLIKCNPWNSL